MCGRGGVCVCVLLVGDGVRSSSLSSLKQSIHSSHCCHYCEFHHPGCSCFKPLVQSIRGWGTAVQLKEMDAFTAYLPLLVKGANTHGGVVDKFMAMLAMNLSPHHASVWQLALPSACKMKLTLLAPKLPLTAASQQGFTI